MKSRNKIKLTVFVATVIISAIMVACHNAGTARKNINLNETVRNGWLQLPDTKTTCDDFDYFPGGGMRNYYCHLASITSFKAVEQAFGKPIFLKGPHRNGELDLNSDRQGYYNPDFPKFLKATMIPAVNDRLFKAQTLPIYNRYVKNLARISYASYYKLNRNPKLLQNAATVIGDKDYESYYDFLQPEFTDNEFDGNVVKTSVAFWIRRSIDKTDKEFADGLTLLLKTYDPHFIPMIHQRLN